jgi:hypothetical protein
MADLIPMLAAVAGQAGEEADEDFKQTVLLLHGDGTNGAQNNTFLDSSTNNFTITRNGNTTQGTFSPFSVGAGYWSNYFDGSGDFLSTNSLTLSGDFTIEAWVFLPSVSTGQAIIGIGDSAVSGGFIFHTTNTGALRIFGNNAQILLGSGSVSANTWAHVAWVRSGTTNTIYLNGVSQGTATNSTSWSGTTRIGREVYSGNPGLEILGYMSNVRIVSGSGAAVYTSAFTPPTAPLTAISNTSLLTCQSNRFVDNSTNNFTITSNGDVKVTAFSPFQPTQAYSPTVTGGSGYFDGTGDYLSIADAAGLRFGTGNFTIQAWIYRNAAGAVHSIAAKGGASTGWVFQVHSDNKLRFTQTTTNIDSTGTIPAGAWTHVAVVREGTGTNQTKLYINGVNDGQATVTTDFNQTEQLNIGADRGNANPMNGYIAGFKYVVGTAETITVPTAPPTGGTALLNFTNAGIFDNTGKNNLETVGNAQIDTTTKKYGTGSMEFDGNGDYVVAPNSVDFAFGTGDFTVEGWVYTTSLASEQTLFDTLPIGGIASRTTSFVLVIATTGKLRFYSNNAYSSSTSNSVSINTWHHFAMVRSSGTINIYIDGVSGLSVSNTTNFSNTGCVIGRYGDDPNGYMNGFIDELRITKVARYTANFSVPTKAFPDQ